MENTLPHPPSQQEKDTAFRLREYDELRKETLERLKALWALEKFALGGSAGIAAWLLTHVAEIGKNSAAWWLPFAFLVICGGRFVTGLRHLGHRSSTYLITIEDHFLGGEGGWEKWFKKQHANESLAYAVVWIVAIVASLLLAIKHPSDQQTGNVPGTTIRN